MEGTKPLSLEEKVNLFSSSFGFKNLPADELRELAALADSRHYKKNVVIFGPDEPCRFFYLVADGLVRVSISSPEGNRLTYLLAVQGEPLNLVGPFTGAPRLMTAETSRKTILLLIERELFTSFAFQHPALITDIIAKLGESLDSSNSRILDMQEKKVDQRLNRILYTLYKKFGSTLNFTSAELAELAGTTTESAIRGLSHLRQKGIVETGRRKISIIKPKAIEQLDSSPIWI
jgi:CRP-like cAMP-binding protein